MRCSKVFAVTSLILVYLSCTNATESASGFQPQSCHAILLNDKSLRDKDGVYEIYVDGQKRDVYCDMTTEGGGWTVIQRRIDGSVDFYQNWQAYKDGFGNPCTEYWMGNDAIHSLTKKGQMLRVELLSFDCEDSYATFSTFRVDNEKNKYKLTISGYEGTAKDSLGYHNGMEFTTFNSDNDPNTSLNCAVKDHGAWWYGYCGVSNLNGRYFDSPVFNFESMHWRSWVNAFSLKGTIMMIKPNAPSN